MKKNIVLIEKTSFVRSNIKRALTEKGFEVYEVEKGETILKSKKFNPALSSPGLLDEITADLFIIDIELESMDGVELLKKLKGHEELRTIPIIVNSFHEDKNTIISVITAGASDYVIKKDNYIDVLVGKVNKFFEKELSTFESTLKAELEWIKFGEKELSFALVVLTQSGEHNTPIEPNSYIKIISKLKERLRLYDWIFPLDDKSIAIILPLASVQNLVALRRKFLDELKKLAMIFNLPLDVQIGFSHYPTNATTPLELMSIAKSQIK
jgi:two-component system chemotaxis response regulator CheY